jgi:hypothetical protein
MSTEQTPNSDRKPTQEELDEIKGRVAKIRGVLEIAGLQASAGATTGTKIVRYFTKVSGVTPKEMTVAQWDHAFSALDGLIKNDSVKAVETVDETVGVKQLTDAEIEADKHRQIQRQAEIKEENTQREARRKQRNEQAGPHAQRIKELAAKFLSAIEAEGYEGYAIVGIPNHLIESQFEKHMESCEDCQNDDVCEKGFDAMCEDDCFENVFIYETRHSFDPGDYAGLAWELGGDGRDGMYPFTSDLLDAAEPYAPGREAAAA